VFYRFPQEADQPGVADGYFGGFSAPHFFRLAYRTFAFKGVMQAKAMSYYAKEQEKQQTHDGRALPNHPVKQEGGTKEQPREVSLTTLRGLDPGLIEYERG
jgi:hypothetical protein